MKGNAGISLDSKGLCFMCLRDIAFANDFNLNKSLKHSEQLFLTRNISSYLKVKIENVFTPTMESTHSNSDRNVTVSLCLDCSITTKRFNGLFQTLELTKLRLQQCIEKIHDIMVEAENDSDRLEEATERMLSNGENIVGDTNLGLSPSTILTNFRSEILTKCARKLKSVPPRVRIQRLRPDPKMLPHFVQLEPTEHGSESSESDYSKAIDDDTSCSTSTDYDTDSEGESDFSDFSNVKKKKISVIASAQSHKRKNPPNHRPCPYCNAVLSNNLSLNLHLVRFHCEHYFSEFRDASITEDHFTKLVNHLLFKDQLDKKESYMAAKSASCHYCEKTLVYKKDHKALPLLAHMVKEHKLVLGLKLKKLQKDPNLTDKIESAVANAGGETCTCGIYVPSRNLMRTHQKYCRAEMPSSSISMSTEYTEMGSNRTWSCLYCNAVLTTKYVYDGHLIRYHCEHYFSNFRDPCVTENLFRKIVNLLLFKDQVDLEKSYASGDKMRCTFCKKSITYRYSNGTNPLMIHMVTAHRMGMVDKLNKLQRDPKVKDKLKLAASDSEGATCECGAYLGSAMKLKVHIRRAYCPKIIKPAKRFKAFHKRCVKCSKMFHPNSIKRHQLTCRVVAPSSNARKRKAIIKVEENPLLTKSKCSDCDELICTAEILNHKMTLCRGKKSQVSFKQQGASSASTADELQVITEQGESKCGIHSSENNLHGNLTQAEQRFSEFGELELQIQRPVIKTESVMMVDVNGYTEKVNIADTEDYSENMMMVDIDGYTVKCERKTQEDISFSVKRVHN